MSSNLTSSISTLTNGLISLLNAFIVFIAYAVQSVANVLQQFAQPLGQLFGIVVVIGIIIELVFGVFRRTGVGRGLMGLFGRVLGAL